MLADGPSGWAEPRAYRTGPIEMGFAGGTDTRRTAKQDWGGQTDAAVVEDFELDRLEGRNTWYLARIQEAIGALETEDLARPKEVLKFRKMISIAEDSYRGGT